MEGLGDCDWLRLGHVYPLVQSLVAKGCISRNREGSVSVTGVGQRRSVLEGGVLGRQGRGGP